MISPLGGVGKETVCLSQRLRDTTYAAPVTGAGQHADDIEDLPLYLIIIQVPISIKNMRRAVHIN